MTDPAEQLAELESLLSEELAAVRSGNLDLAPAMGERVGFVLGGIDPAMLSGEHRLQIEKIKTLRRQLTLTLNVEKQELAEKLGHTRTGRGALRAYKQGGLG